jgi:NADPH:quinone reductase-like Zn-dependent oxidoreductase
MKAIVCAAYGPPEVLRLAEVEKPRPRAHEILVRVHAAGISDSDALVRGWKVPKAWFPLRLVFGIRRPRMTLGAEVSGEVVEVGARVTRFEPGDEVMATTGMRGGGCAEYARLRDGGRKAPWHSLMVAKPPNVSHAEAATIPGRAMLASFFLGQGAALAGKNVLIYGASGGVGTFAVQLARHAGAEVAGVCGPKNVELVRSLGASHVLDYTNPGEEAGGPYQVIFDAAGTRKPSPLKERCRAALAPDGKWISVDARAVIPVGHLDRIRDLVESGAIHPVLDRTFSPAEAVDAHRYVEAGHKRGGIAMVFVP